MEKLKLISLFLNLFPVFQKATLAVVGIPASSIDHGKMEQ